MKPTYFCLFLVALTCLSGCQQQATPVSAIQQDPTATSLYFIIRTASLQSPTATATRQPAPTLSPTPSGCPQSHGSVTSQTLDSKLLPKPLDYQLYLPPCYEAKKANGYPLLILLHGQLFKDDQWIRLGVPDTADALILSGEVTPFIVAMPYEEYSLANPYQSNFGKSVVEELLPWLDSHYDTCAKKECRAIGGLSRGAAWAMHEGLIYWNVFGAIGGHSMPPFTGDPGYLPLWLRNIPAGQIPAIYMDIGDKDVYFPYASNWDKLLTYYHVPHEFHVNSGKHEEAYWSAHVQDYLLWYTSHWQK